MRAPFFWRARGVRERAICEPLQRRTFDSAASLCSVFQTLRKDAVESIVRRRGGLQIARVTNTMRTPVFGIRVVLATRAICKLLRQRTVDPTASLCNV
eukprot:7402899-Lingulodinium_polyedra.AAC.1